jgi:hypothetical protein
MRTSTIELNRADTDGLILCLPVAAATDPLAMRWRCAHDVHFFESCFPCILESNIQRMEDGLESEEPKYEEITIDCERCFHRTYFVFPLGELLVCESCWKKAGAE